jgi:hypothetical protein
MRIIFVIFLGLVILKINAQNKINSYQYWFDNQYSSAVKTSITPVQNFTLNTQINTPTLLNGLHLFHIKFFDDSARASITNSSFFYKPTPASGITNITGYQYWFDGDYANALTQPIIAATNYTLANDLATAGLLNGIHVLQVRFKDNNNRWSETMSTFFYKASLTGSTNNITAFQYWFDNDFANVVTQTITPANSFTLANDLGTAGLLNGIHVLQVRFKDNGNKWSETNSQFFYKAASSTGTNNIVAFQYWFDENFTNAVQQQIIPAANYTLSAPIDAVQLIGGLHILQVRFLDKNNQWSSTNAQFFYKSQAGENNSITRFQYWFDQDFAGAIQQNIAPSVTYNLVEQLNANSLLNGLHAVSVRFSGASGKWSSPNTQFFYKEKTGAVSQNKITGYRYWFDEGDGSLNLVDIAPFMNTLILNQPIAADGMDSGQHAIHFQFRDANGKWSMVTSDSATVTAKTIYTFNGNGNWSNKANWVNKVKPPINLAGAYNIFIDPAPGGKCVLDVNQQLTTGAIITVRTGKSLVIPGNLNITQ